MNFNKKLVGERIILNLVEPKIKIASKIYEIINSQRDHFSPWFIWEKNTKCVEDTLKYLFEIQEEFEKKKKLSYGIYFEDQLIGLITIFNISETNKSGVIGYWLSSKFINKGFMSEAVKIVEKNFFEKQKFNRLSITCDIENIASKKVILKCGYIQEGCLRKDSYSEYHKGYRDTLIFSKLKEEYSKKK